jgi:hypothetical protein
MKIKSFICILMITAIALCNFSACSKNLRFPNTPSGFEFALNESVLSIEQKLTLDKEDDGYIPGMTAKAKISGLTELSYYDAAVTLTWTYEYLSDNNKNYEEGSFHITVPLDASGCGSYEEKLVFDNYRSVKNISLSLSFEGSAIKK